MAMDGWQVLPRYALQMRKTCACRAGKRFRKACAHVGLQVCTCRQQEQLNNGHRQCWLTCSRGEGCKDWRGPQQTRKDGWGGRTAASVP